MIDAGVISEDENFELIEGEIAPMSPKGNQQEVIKSALNRLLAKNAPDDLRLGVETSVYLSENTFIEPDFCLYPKTILPVDVRGGDVLLAIEVAASSLGYDRGLKARIYAKHGIREIWVIDTAKRATWVHKGPRADGSWDSIEQHSSQAVLRPESLPDLTIVVADLD